MSKKRTKAEKQAYFRDLRQRWQSVKKALDEKQIDEAKAIIATHGWNVSPMGFLFVSLQMKKQGFDGLPYLDAKTYKGWLQNGFRVRKGEKSTLSGVTWIGVGGTKDEDGNEEEYDYMLPREYHLFHRSQVDAA
jgi:hypothetical protein